MSNLKNVVIVSAKRTPVGSFNGKLSGISATRLGAKVIQELVSDAGIKVDLIDEVIMGNVLSAGLGQAPARQAALYAGLPDSVECFTINKMCGSGLKSVMLAAQAIQAGDADIVVAGGMENMSMAPYLLEKARTGYRLGHGQLIDSMIRDGLWDVYTDQHMGNCAEICARDKKYTREMQDDFAKESYRKAIQAQENGWFGPEIIPVEIPNRRGESTIVTSDEEPENVRFEKMPKLRPAFEKEGTITAANASKINDGAACVLLMTLEKAQELNLKPLARIVAQASAAQAPEWFTTAPTKAITKVLKKSGLRLEEIDLWEINEAFAPVAMAAIDDFSIDPDKVNVHGGAIALGHPIGASGARILTSLLHGMNRLNSHYGLATLCIGGGEASALIVESVS